MDFTFRTDYNIFFILLIFVSASAVSYFYYRHTKLEPVPKKIFTFLRFLSVFFILLLLLSPVLSYIKNFTSLPVNVFLIDNSLSMTIDNRKDTLKKIIEEKIQNTEKGNAESRYFLFSEDIIREIRDGEFDSLDFSGKYIFSTNMSSSVNSLKEIFQNQNLSSVTVISDGIINEGGNSAAIVKSLNVPFNYILIGDTVQKKDVLVRNIYYNKTAFIESSVPVKAEINSFNYDKDVTVNLFEDNKLIDSKNISLTNDKISYEVPFNVISYDETVKKYKIEVKGSDDEITLKNNYEEFFIKYKNNKFRILVLAGAPGPDFAFLKEELLQIKNFEITFLTQKSRTEFYEPVPSDLGAFDSYIFIGYPTAATNISVLNELSVKMKKNNSSLIFFSGKNIDYRKLALVEDRLPFKTLRISESEQETGIKNILKPDNDVFRNTDLVSSVNNLPLIFKTASEFSVNPNAESYMIMTGNSEPALILENTDRNKSMAFLAYGFYKWRLNSRNNRSEELLRYILSNSVVSLTGKESGNKFIIETTQPAYSGSQDVKFEAALTGSELKGDEMIKLEITGINYDTSFYLSKTGRNLYSGSVNIPVTGDYEYTAGLISESRTLQTLKGRFTIDENNFEFKSTRADNSLLSMLSNNTKGFNLSDKDSRDIKDIFSVMNNNSTTEFRARNNFEFDINPYYLSFLIFLLCLEWFLRKRYNLP
ncbi:MAG: VWA domain-containing protein [Bacteroidetes bacterium]|nr:VWA domain-containing protein [Bacteroidota bacterium]